MEFLSPTEAARRLGLSRKRVYQLIADRRLRAERVTGGGFVILQQDLDHFAMLQRRAGRPPAPSRTPEAAEAHKAVARALRAGTLTRAEDCSQCGGRGLAGDYPIQAHHDDYSKPLEVMWMCGSCHKLRHPWIRPARATP